MKRINLKYIKETVERQNIKFFVYYKNKWKDFH